MGVVVAFDYARWIARYPEFSAIGAALADEYFAEACIQHNNTPTGPVCDANAQSVYLNMMTAHIAAMYAQSSGSPSPGSPQASNTPVGRITSASEGSVSASFESNFPQGTAQWYQQTKYGAAYWNATRAYRSARYRAFIRPVVDGLYVGGPYGYGGRGWGGGYY
jgi:hypothetical protein